MVCPVKPAQRTDTPHAVLINTAHIENFSVRHLGAYLTSRGYRVSILHYEGRKEGVFEPMPPAALDVLAKYCKDCDLVGVTLCPPTVCCWSGDAPTAVRTA